MHAATLQLVPVMAAEKSHTSFYIAAGVLVAWAVVISLLIGLRRPSFPGNLLGERAIISVSAILVAATAATAVIDSGVPTRASAASPNAPVPSGPTTTLSLAAASSGELAYSTKSLHAKAGNVQIGFTNLSPLEHNVTVERAGHVLGATPTFRGGTRTLTLHLPPGTYTYFCSVPGHRQAGMQGTLTVL
ncbi:MAG: plastocyanin/azurin family copper-binding protein [Solirubrobacterales bacterium]|nr:plastocyanin/azurin family copper-binding protein [Solirubrobacterales bacterium]